MAVEPPTLPPRGGASALLQQSACTPTWRPFATLDAASALFHTDIKSQPVDLGSNPRSYIQEIAATPAAGAARRLQ
eukprot:3161606-Prymnesium_polylepis.1